MTESKKEPNTLSLYPLMETQTGELQSASGRHLDAITLEAVARGELSASDLQITRTTLQAQAEVAQKGGFPQLAANLSRAAELTTVPNEELLRMYELLRPRRATFDELMALAARLSDQYDAPETAALVSEAAHAYRSRNLLRRE